MSYYFTTTVAGEFEEVITAVEGALAAEGFGILTEIDVKATLKKKLDVDFRPYKILGACNPPFAHQALLAEDKIGIMLPCNVVVQKIGEKEIEVAAVDPVASMQAVDNRQLGELADTVRAKMKAVIAAVAGEAT